MKNNTKGNLILCSMFGTLLSIPPIFGYIDKGWAAVWVWLEVVLTFGGVMGLFLGCLLLMNYAFYLKGE